MYIYNLIILFVFSIKTNQLFNLINIVNYIDNRVNIVNILVNRVSLTKYININKR